MYRNSAYLAKGKTGVSAIVRKHKDGGVNETIAPRAKSQEKSAKLPKGLERGVPWDDLEVWRFCTCPDDCEILLNVASRMTKNCSATVNAGIELDTPAGLSASLLRSTWSH